jgi:hypothetical protein
MPLTTPPPSVAQLGLCGDGATYEISFSVPSGEKIGTGQSEVYAQGQRHLLYASIPLAVAGLAKVPRMTVLTLAALLEMSDLFDVVVATGRNLLANHLPEVRITPGETLIRENDAAEAHFVIAAGTVEVTTGNAGHPRVMHRSGPSESLGEIGLITGAPYAATATALTAVRAYRLDKDSICVAIAKSPELATALEALAERGQTALGNGAVAHTQDQLQPPEMFLPGIRGFLQRSAAGSHEAVG